MHPMAIRSFYINLIIRVLLMAFSALLTGWLFFDRQAFTGTIFFVLIFILQVIELIRFLNRSNRKIAFFFEAIRNEDFTLYFPEKTGNRSLRELNKSLNNVNERIKKIKFELQEQEQYFKTILEQVSLGVLTFNDKGTIFLANRASRNLLNYEHLTHIEQIQRIDQKVYSALKNAKPGDRKLVSFYNGKETIQLSLKSTLFKTTQDTLQLVTIQDIKNELEAKELESWVKLIRVMTHEIMNSVAPITSLSQTLLGYFKNLNGKKPEKKTIANTMKGLEVINDRGNGLMGFVETYRKLTHLPQPDKKPIVLRELFDKIITLVGHESTPADITFLWKVNPPELEILADKKQVSQLLINLMKNATEALRDTLSGKITLEAKINENGRPQLSVTDNGPGISPELMDKIFVPFYTTKESGTGIGLSLARQIMQLHGGSLKIVSAPGKNTSAILVF
jgi:two-component system, NtrC family, nitrogen regulation sensor histidine kinase NtrY